MLNDEDNFQIPELLAPAGSIEALYAGVSSGADAVYLSGRKFGARRFAKNFSDDELKYAIEFCHSRGVFVYVTLNTLIADDEMSDALKEMLYYYTIGADAVLVQDTGLLKATSECIPNLTLHASTQMTITTTAGAVWACRKKLQRVVLARELSADEVTSIKKNSFECSPELEIFAHGALCYCYSGQCFFSSFLGGRSGNRGMCAQPCRKKYMLMSGKRDKFSGFQDLVNVPAKGEYLLSPRDLCLYDRLDEAVLSHVKSLKIEGRMKSADYVALSVSVYRKALDEIKSGRWEKSPVEKEKLNFAYNRLFSVGYLLGQTGSFLMSYDRPDNRGVFLGTVVSCNKKTKRTHLKLNGSLEPQTGDGLSVRLSGRESDDGFILRPPYSFESGEFFFISPYSLRKGDRVYITKRQAVSQFASAVASKDGLVYEKIPVDVFFSVEGKNPVVRGSLKLFGKKFETFYKASFDMADAEKRPVSISDLKKVFGKTGGTQYCLGEFSADYKEDLFLPAGLLNELRREFYSVVEKKTTEFFIPDERDIAFSKENIENYVPGKREGKKFVKTEKNEKTEKIEKCEKNDNTVKLKNFEEISVFFYADNIESVKGAVFGGCRRIYFEPDIDIRRKDAIEALLASLKKASEVCQKNKVSLVWKLPRIINDSYLDFAASIIENLPRYSELFLLGVMTDSFGAAYALRKKNPDLKIYGSFGLNIFNSSAVCEASSLLSGVMLSPELSERQIKVLIEKIPKDVSIETEYFVHGAFELMLSKNNLVESSVLKKTDLLHVEKSSSSNAHAKVSSIASQKTSKKESLKSSLNEPVADNSLADDSENFAYAIRDEKGGVFPLYTDSYGRTYIYNSVETCLIDSLPQIIASGLFAISIDGRRKGYNYAEMTVKSYLKGIKAVKSDSPGMYNELESLKKRLQKISSGGITGGHFKKGV